MITSLFQIAPRIDPEKVRDHSRLSYPGVYRDYRLFFGIQTSSIILSFYSKLVPAFSSMQHEILVQLHQTVSQKVDSLVA
jgi:hypothetical protein